MGAYAHLRGETVVSADLDIYVSPQTLDELLSWAQRHGIVVRQRPQPRSVPVAFLEWAGLEINALTWVVGLPDPGVAVRSAREFTLSGAGGIAVPLADPFDLLANKLAVRREKDLPHISILRSFVEEEVVAGFEHETGRRRLQPARRLLEVLKQRMLPEPLARRLLPLAREPVDFRFLISSVPNAELAREVLERAGDRPELVPELETILESREFGTK